MEIIENKEFTDESKLLGEAIRLFDAHEYGKAFQYFSEIVKLKKEFNANFNIKAQTSYFLGLCALKLQYLDVCKECLITLNHDVKPLVNNNKKVLQYISDLEMELLNTLLQKGIENGKKGNFEEEAVRYFNMELEIDKNNVWAIYNKGLACYYLKQFETTKECFVKINKKMNNNYLLFIAQILHNLDNDSKAFECLERVTGDIPLLFSKAELLGDLEISQSKEMANECFKQITQMELRENNRYDYMFQCLANLLKKDRDFKQACSIYWDSIKNGNNFKEKGNEESFSYYNSFSPFMYDFLYNISSNQKKEEIEVFHYTGIEALKNILENQKLWVTRADFLNDSTETKYICKVIDEINEDDFDKNIWHDINKIILDIKYGLNLFYNNKPSDSEHLCINKYIENNRTKDKKEIYILSTTTDKDSLPMWLNYSGCDGYNIKINYFKYEKYLRANNILNLHGEVVYISKNYNKEKLINLIKGIYLSGKENDVRDEDIEYSIISNLTILALFIKHPGFEYEKELKENQYIKSNTKYRIKNNTLIPYIEIPIPKEKIEQITMSPICNELNKTTFKEFVKSIEFYIDDDYIKKSDIPYRKI